jgi:polar amino acid transport system substrate-binding protein
VLDGTDDEIMRIWSYGIDSPDMNRVPTAYYYLQTGAFIDNDSDVVIRNTTDLAHYRLARVRGVKHTNSITAALLSVNDMSNTQQMMRYLSAGIVNVALTNIIEGKK